MRIVGEERKISESPHGSKWEVPSLAVSDSKKKANAKWDSENMATLACKVKKAQAEAFKAYCASVGKTANTVLRDYVLECIEGKEVGK
jgi:hypothetical protein